MKTNKAFTKRIRVTKKGKLLVRKSGGSHFNAKESRRKQLKRKTLVKIKMSNKNKRRFLPKQ
jgi:ribosomal protein L35